MHLISRQQMQTWLGDAGTRLLLLFTVLYLAYTLMSARGWPGVTDTTFITDLASVGFSFVTVIFTWRASSLLVLPQRMRRGWRYLAYGFIAYFLGDAIWFYCETVLGIEPYPSLADVAYLAYYPLILAGLIRFTIGIPSKTQREQFWTDAITIVIGFGTIIWYFFLRPVAQAEYNSTLELVLAEVYPALDLLLFFGVTLLILQRRYLRFSLALTMFLASILVQFTADLWFSYQNLQDTYGAGGIVDWLYITSLLLMIFSAHIADIRIAGIDVIGIPATQRHTISALPYIAISMTFALLLFVAHKQLLEPIGGLIVAAVVLTSLIAVRQVLSLRLVRETEARFSSLARNSTDVIAILGADLRVSFASESAERIFGVAPDKLDNTRFLDLVHPDDRSQFEHMLKTALAGTQVTQTVEWLLAGEEDGQRVIETVVTNMSKDPLIGGLILNSRDITERKQTEAITMAKEEAERSSQAKSEFLSRMSHELRTPLHSILGFSQLLEGSLQNLAQEEKQSLHHIRNSGKHLLELINEVLDLTRIDAGKLELFLEDIDMPEIVSECLSLVRGMAADKNITIHLNQPAHITVYADRTRLKEVLLNLFSNAIKYNHQGGSITITCETGAGRRVRLLVNDTGIGIPEEQQERVFQPFTRIQRKDSEIEGTGIGLTISKRLVEAMGGEIGFTSKADAGSTFWFDLRVGRTEAPGMPQASDAMERRGVVAAVPAAKGRVLYIEDTPANVQLMRLIMKRLPGVELIEAPSAELGIALAKDTRPDLILMDIGLPGMDGIEALGVLRQDQVLQDIPVIAISAAAMGHDIERIQQAGFDDYLSKPYNIQEVPTFLSKYLM